ncbi:polyamine ABC transporter substrate-binding protein [Vibrio sp.]|uniref:polyamine ABC transporter substrate-binding protein n=1 Tax=Vibrio sp. TaxID=678 RepID=UPI003D10DBC8
MKAKIALAFMFAGFLSHPAVADEVKIYTWEEYFSEDVIAEFEEQTGHQIKQIYFDSEKLRDEVVTTERVNAYDLFVMDGYSLNAYSTIGLAKNLTRIKLENGKNIDPIAIQNCGEYGIPYSWGTMGIAYRETRFPEGISSWSEIFERAAANSANLIMPLDDIDTIAVALLGLGYDPMSNDENQLKQAYQALLNIKPNVIDFRTAPGYVLEKRKQSEIDLAVLYTGETYLISEATGQDDWRYVVPEEGTLIWYECFAAPADKPLSQATLSFLDFINRPEIAARNAEEVWLATTNKTALSLVSKEYLDDVEINPKLSNDQKSYYYQGIENPAMKKRARIVSILGN